MNTNFSCTSSFNSKALSFQGLWLTGISPNLWQDTIRSLGEQAGMVYNHIVDYIIPEKIGTQSHFSSGTRL